MTFEETCDIGDAVEVTTDDPGTTRYDRSLDGQVMQKSRYSGSAAGASPTVSTCASPARALVDEGSTANRTISRAELDTRLADRHKATAR